MSKIMNISDVIKDEVPGLRTIHRIINENIGAEKIGVLMVKYNPNVTGGVHYHERRESAYIVLEGKAKLSLNGIEYELRPNMAVFISPRDTHGIVSTGDEYFKMIEVYSPLEPDRIDIS
jgi:mannose-6-phosphate isomerase-like protein (cupin superfamily)